MQNYKPLSVSDPSYGTTRMRPNRRTVMCLSIVALIVLLIMSSRMSPPAKKDDYLTVVKPDGSEKYQEPPISPPSYENSGTDMNDMEEVDGNDDEVEGDNEDFDIPPPPAQEPAIDSDEITKVDDKKPTENWSEENVINTSNHYTMLVVIASEAKQIARRNLMRSKYFGINNNLLPCMEANSDVYYRFWVYGGTEKLTGDEHRLYEAENMEYNDIVEMPDVKSFDQLAVVEWAEIELGRTGISYDYMVMQDSYTFAHLQNIKRELEDGVIGEGTDSPYTLSTENPNKLVWGSFGTDSVDRHVFVVGTSAAKEALLHNDQYEQTDEPLFTRMYNYYAASEASDPDGASERGGPEFVREDGEDNNNRIIVWQNNIESVKAQDFIIANVYQDSDFSEIARWTSLTPLTACYTIPSASKSAPESNEPIDEDEDQENFAEAALEEDAALQAIDAPAVSVAIVTSSYIYPDDCMLPSARLSAENKRKYALKHGYSFVARSTEFAQQLIRGDRKPVWGKLDVIEKVLPKYDWIFWLDMDAVIMNQNTTIESLLTKFENEYEGGKKAFDEEIDFIVAKPHGDPMINAGVFLFRNTPWSMNYLRKVQGMTDYYMKHPSYEQLAMWMLMQEPGFKERSLLLDGDNHTFNTFPNRYHTGDFVVHYAPDKCPNDAVLKGLELAQRIENGEVLEKLE